MKQYWETDELIDHFTLLPKELKLVNQKPVNSKVTFAVLLKFFQKESQFPTTPNVVPTSVVAFIAKQLNLPSSVFNQNLWGKRTLVNHRRDIRQFYGFCEGTMDDAEAIKQWLMENILDHVQEWEAVKSEAYAEFRKRKIELPSEKQINRMVQSTMHLHEQRFFETIHQRLPSDTIARMDVLIDSWVQMEETDTLEEDEDQEQMSFRKLNFGPGNPTKDNLLMEIKKLKTLRLLELPHDLFMHISSKHLKLYRQRAVSEDLRELRRHQPHVRYPLLAAFFWSRSTEITDNLIELLLLIVHNINARAERKIDREVLHEIKKVRGKKGIMVDLLEAALDHPEGQVKEVLYPVVEEQTMRDLLKEMKPTNPVYQEKIYWKMRNSYSHSYRSAIAQLLDVLEFQSNNHIHRPVIKALDLLKTYAGTGQIYFAVTDDVPIDDVVPPKWKETVLETGPQGERRVNRINYEISVLHALREKLRCKEIWVVGANRYRNPEDDLPSDFEKRQDDHYQALKQPQDPTSLRKNPPASILNSKPFFLQRWLR